MKSGEIGRSVFGYKLDNSICSFALSFRLFALLTCLFIAYIFIFINIDVSSKLFYLRSDVHVPWAVLNVGTKLSEMRRGPESCANAILKVYVHHRHVSSRAIIVSLAFSS